MWEMSWVVWLLGGLLLVLVVPSIRIIGPDEVGLVIKRFSLKRLKDGEVIAFGGRRVTKRTSSSLAGGSSCGSSTR